MNDFATLWYLDYHRLTRGLIQVVRKPSRLVWWLLIASYFGSQMLLQTHAGRTPWMLPVLADPWATAVALAILSLTMFLLYVAAKNGRVRTSSEPVDALFLVRSAIPEATVAAWLYLRYFFITYGRSIAALAYFAIMLRSLHGAPVLACAGVFLCVEMLRIPAAFAGRARPRLATVFQALTLTFAALLVLDVAAALVPQALFVQRAVVGLSLGRALVALLAGNAGAMLALYALALAALILGWLMARDIYPEIYAGTTLRALLVQRRLRGAGSIGLGQAAALKPTRSGTTSLRGPWVEIWKQLAFLRRSNGRTSAFVALGLGVAAGVAAGIGGRADEGIEISVLIGFAALCTLTMTVMSVSLSLDLAKPLWWLGSGSTFEKLLAWAIGSSLPAMAMMIAAAAVDAMLSGPRVLPEFLAAAIVLPMPMRGVGGLSYSLLPNRTDQRGPAVMLRMLLAYAAIAVAAAAGAGCGAVAASIPLGCFAGLATFAIEGLAALGFAAWRIDGRGVEFALAE